MATWEKIKTHGGVNSVEGDFVATFSDFSTAGFFKGDTISFGTGDAFTKGKLYVYGNTGWALADKDTALHGPLLIAGATADTTGTDFPDKGMCIKGLFRIDTISGTETLGSVVYLGDSGNVTTDVSEFEAGDIIRPVGYLVNTTYNVIYLDPDKTWVELS
tara:strand:- start:4336 stop:4815 length:480 start_codon:yes stop_codon:yes gene_type:complete